MNNFKKRNKALVLVFIFSLIIIAGCSPKEDLPKREKLEAPKISKGLVHVQDQKLGQMGALNLYLFEDMHEGISFSKDLLTKELKSHNEELSFDKFKKLDKEYMNNFYKSYTNYYDKYIKKDDELFNTKIYNLFDTIDFDEENEDFKINFTKEFLEDFANTYKNSKSDEFRADILFPYASLNNKGEEDLIPMIHVAYDSFEDEGKFSFYFSFFGFREE